MNSWQQFINGFDLDFFNDILLSVIPALVCITLHELSHGYVAYRLGDPTAKEAGRLTLNPIRHPDLFGFLMLIVAHVGWAKPVPVNMRNFEDPKRGMAITALAGPVSNFLITAVTMFIFGILLPFVSGTAAFYGMNLLSMTAYLSLGLGLFNLLPIPPLDGSKVLFSLIPDEAYYKLMRYEKYGMIVLVVLAYTGVTGSLLARVMDTVFDWFLVFMNLGLRLSSLFIG